MTENLPSLVKEKDTQNRKYRESTQDGPKKAHTKTHQIKIARLKDKDRIPKAAREKSVVTDKDAAIRLSSDFSRETFQARRD